MVLVFWSHLLSRTFTLKHAAMWVMPYEASWSDRVACLFLLVFVLLLKLLLFLPIPFKLQLQVVSPALPLLDLHSYAILAPSNCLYHIREGTSQDLLCMPTSFLGLAGSAVQVPQHRRCLVSESSGSVSVLSAAASLCAFCDRSGSRHSTLSSTIRNLPIQEEC